MEEEQEKARKLTKLSENLFKEYQSLEEDYGREIESLEKLVAKAKKDRDDTYEKYQHQRETTSDQKFQYEELMLGLTHRIGIIVVL